MKQEDIKVATDRHLSNLSPKVDRLKQGMLGYNSSAVMRVLTNQNKKTVSLSISDTLTEQNYELEKLEEKVVDTDTRISKAIKSVSELIDKTNGNTNLCYFCAYNQSQI